MYPLLDSFLVILQHTLLLDNFPTTFMMAQFSLPIKRKRHSIANLLACTRRDYNARLGAFFFHASTRYLPETKTPATPIAMSFYYYQRRRPDSHHAFFILIYFFPIYERKKIGSKPPSPHRKTGRMIRNANLMHLPPPISQLLGISHPANRPF